MLHYVPFYDVHKSNFLLPLASVAVLLFGNNLELTFLTLSLWQVVSVNKKEKVKQRPQALNTVEMLRVASHALGIVATA